MRTITVRNPWAQAITRARKDVENRTRNVAGAYRGAIAIHAAKRVNTLAEWDAFARRHRVAARVLVDAPSGIETFGAIIGVVDLVDVHHATDCDGSTGESCSPWALPDNFHLMLANPRPLAEPIPYTGALGLRRLDPETILAITRQIGRTA